MSLNSNVKSFENLWIFRFQAKVVDMLGFLNVKGFKNLSHFQLRLLTLFFYFCCLASLNAHESRPLFIQITAKDAQHYTLQITTPNSVNKNNLPHVLLPDNFKENVKVQRLKTTTSGYVETRQFETPKAFLKGQTFYIQFPTFNPSITTIVQINDYQEATQTYILSPSEQQFSIPEVASASTIISQYTRLGIEHIWAGIDHLLFLICLLMITGFSKKLWWTITGFTIAHSITLVLSTLGWLKLSVQPVEACIALSIVFLCYEMIHHHETKSSLTYRYPVVVSSSFGLLHGFGFAAVLNEIGLPDHHLLEALLFFNIGVEIGQIIFLLVAIIIQIFLLKLFTTAFKKHADWILKLTIYSVGIVASYWLFERLF